MQVQRRLLWHSLCGVLRLDVCRVAKRVAQRRPVVAQGRSQVFGFAQRVFHVQEVIGRVVSGRPVLPDHVDERHVVGWHHHVSEPVLEEEHVPAPFELIGVGDEGEAHRTAGRNRHRNHLRPTGGLDRRCAVDDRGAPVVPDQDGTVIAAEVLVERTHVERRGAGLIGA